MDWEDAKHMGVGAHFDFLPDPSAAPAPTVSPEVQHLLDTNHITLDQAQHMSIDQLLHLVPEQTVDTGPTPAQWVMGEIAVAALVGGAYAVGRSGGKKAAQGPEAATTTKKTTETKVKKVKGAPLPGSPEAAEAANRKRKEDDEEDNKKKNKGKKKKTS
jgi:hypothetical protein